jgi:hypothetical protein
MGNGSFLPASGNLLLVLPSTVILGSKSRRAHDHILLFHDSGSGASLPVALECFEARFKFFVRTSQKTPMCVAVTSSTTVSIRQRNNGMTIDGGNIFLQNFGPSPNYTVLQTVRPL